jgi:hypothetical protein
MPSNKNTKDKKQLNQPANTRSRKLNRGQKKKIVKTTKKLPSAIFILKQALRHIVGQKGLYAGILLIFGLLYLVLVKGLAAEFQLEETGDAIDSALGDTIDAPTKGFALLGTLFGAAGSTSGQAASVYQVLLLVMISLVIVWTLRQTYDNRTTVSVKAAYYKSMTPLVPYILVGFVMLLQAVPAILAVSIYSLVTSEAVAVGYVEQFVWLFFLLSGIITSLYFLSSSLFASYIVTLPGMTPLRALRTAKGLVRFRRWAIMRKLLFLPFICFVSLLVIFLPLVLIAPLAAELLFIAASLFIVLFTHSYLYVLYRELL